NGKYHAVGAICPHYGGPLAEGGLCGEGGICPWHHASFDVKTGDLLGPPPFVAVSRFQVQIKGGGGLGAVSACAEGRGPPAEDRRAPTMAPRDARQDERAFVILGGGAAGYMAAQTLREEGFRGRVLMVTREDRLPYDRPNLSKDYLQGHAEPEWMPLRPDEFFNEHGIEVLRGREATQ